MKGKKNYPYPSYKNPIILSPDPVLARQTLQEFFTKIERGELTAQKDKIPTLPFATLHGVSYHLFCFECFIFIREALRHGVIKNRNDARFWGLGEKKALCGDCLEKRLEEMSVRKRHLWAEYKKRGY